MGHKKVTSNRVASKASKALRSKRTGKTAKSVSGSALAQSRGKHGKRKK